MRTTRMYIALLGVTICCGNLANGEMKNAEVDFRPFVRDMWTAESTLEKGVEALVQIPVDQLPRLLAAHYQLDEFSTEGLDFAFGFIVEEFRKRMDAAEWREIVQNILTDDEYPKNLKVTIARTRYHAEIMNNDIASIIDMLEDAVKPVDELWVYAQRGIASALISSHSAAFRKTGAKTIGQVENVAEKQMRSMMTDLLRLGTDDSTLYQHVTAKTLAAYRRVLPLAVFEQQIVDSFKNLSFDATKEILILESIYRSPSYSPSESGPVWNRIKELERKADLQQIDLTDEDRRRIDVILAE